MQDTVHDRPHPHPTSAAMSASPGSVKRRRIDLSTEDDSLPPVDEAEAAAALDVDPAASASPSSSPDGGSAARPQRKAKMEASSRVHAMAFSLQDETEVGGRRRSSNNNAYTSKSSSRRRATTNGAAGHSRKRPLEISDDDVAEEEADEMEVEEDEEEPADAVDADEDAAMEEAPRPAAASKHAGSKSATRHPSPSTTAAAASASAPAAASSSAPAAAASSSTTTHSRPRAAHAEAALKAAAAAASSAPHAHTIIPEKKSGHHSNSHRAAAASSSSSSSFSNGGEAKPKKQRDLRRDKRISGFGAWKVVHKSSIPAMTYEGYEDLATETLEKETQAAVKQSLPYTPQGTDAYHRDPTDILTGKAEQPLTLMRRVDTRCGREEYKVKALRTIEPREVVTFLGGRLMESVKANKQQREEWNQHFHMNRKWLKEFFEYPGAHDLVVSTKNHRTIASYIRSPEERDDEGEGPNLKADVCFEPNSGLFYVIYYAIERIRRGQEVFCMPFLGDWQDRSHREMFLYSRISHWYHKWARILELNLRSHHIAFDATIPANMRSIILTADQEEKFLNIPGMDQGVLPEPMPIEKSMRVVSVEDAMAYCQCEYALKARQVDLSTEVQHYIDAVGDFIPDYLEIRGPVDGEEDEDGNPIMGVNRYHVDRDEVLALIESGFRADCLELREELGIHSPVRHFTPPNYRAFCVVAIAPIPKGTFVFAYAGEITEEIIHRDSAYVYVMEREQIRRTVRNYHGPDLSLDALKVGNISRFVNDNTYRMGEADEKGSTANLETQFLFVKGTIHLGFYTTRDVAVNEELVSQYGEDYWKTINKQLISEHKKFYDYINPYTRKLESLTYQHLHALPPTPPDSWQTSEEELFTEKLLPYPKLAGGEDDEEADGVAEVERILQMHTDWDGSVKYLVKWQHSSSADNSWIKAKQVLHCEELIQEFLETEANRRGGSQAKLKTTAKKSTAGGAVKTKRK